LGESEISYIYLSTQGMACKTGAQVDVLSSVFALDGHPNKYKFTSVEVDQFDEGLFNFTSWTEIERCNYTPIQVNRNTKLQGYLQHFREQVFERSSYAS
jgi:hypothetical protein